MVAVENVSRENNTTARILTTSIPHTIMSAPAPAHHAPPHSYAESYYFPYTLPCHGSPISPAAAMMVADDDGPMPGALLSPNFVYTSTHPDGSRTLCTTEILGAGSLTDPACSGANSLVAFSQKTGPGVDALTRGLLGRLSPMVTYGHENVIPYNY